MRQGLQGGATTSRTAVASREAFRFPGLVRLCSSTPRPCLGGSRQGVHFVNLQKMGKRKVRFLLLSLLCGGPQRLGLLSSGLADGDFAESPFVFLNPEHLLSQANQLCSQRLLVTVSSV